MKFEFQLHPDMKLKIQGENSCFWGMLVNLRVEKGTLSNIIV